MPRTPAKITQADVARAIRAAMQAGASAVEIRPDGSILVSLMPLPAAEKGAQELDQHSKIEL